MLLAQTIAVAGARHDAAQAGRAGVDPKNVSNSSGSRLSPAARPASGRVQVQVPRLDGAGIPEPVQERAAAPPRTIPQAGAPSRRRAAARSRRRARRRRSVCARCVCGRAPSSPGGSDHSSQSSCGRRMSLSPSATTASVVGSSARNARAAVFRIWRRLAAPARRRCPPRPMRPRSSTVAASMPPIANQGTRSVSRAARTSARPPAAASLFVGVP